MRKTKESLLTQLLFFLLLKNRNQMTNPATIKSAANIMNIVPPAASKSDTTINNAKVINSKTVNVIILIILLHNISCKYCEREKSKLFRLLLLRIRFIPFLICSTMFHFIANLTAHKRSFRQCYDSNSKNKTLYKLIHKFSPSFS